MVAQHQTQACTLARIPLGPALGQCCGGVVHLKFERISAADAPALKQRLLANGSSAEEVLMQLARGLTNKLLHAPSVQLKKLSAEGRLDALAMAQELFALNEGSTDKSLQ